MLITNLGKPALERLGFGGWDGLDYSENTFGVGTVDLLSATCRIDPKGGGNLPPPFG